MAGTIALTPVKHRSRNVVRTDCAITTDGSGVASATVVGVGFGRLVQVFYDGALATSAVITVSDSKTGATLFTYTTGTQGTPASFRPTQNVVDNAGATIAAAITAIDVWRDIYVAGKLSVAVASGGTTLTSKLAFVVDEVGLADKAITN